MSYDEYKEEFERAQKNSDAPYRMFAFDLKGSKKMDDFTRYDAQIKSLKTIILLAKKLQEIEKTTKKAIVFHDERVKLNVDFKLTNNPNLTNPCVNCGDTFAIAIFNGIYSDKEIFDLFLECAKNTGNFYTYNVAVGNFETTDYGLATKKCWNGYCLAELTDNKKRRTAMISAQENTTEMEK